MIDSLWAFYFVFYRASITIIICPFSDSLYLVFVVLFFTITKMPTICTALCLTDKFRISAICSGTYMAIRWFIPGMFTINPLNSHARQLAWYFYCLCVYCQLVPYKRSSWCPVPLTTGLVTFCHIGTSAVRSIFRVLLHPHVAHLNASLYGSYPVE